MREHAFGLTGKCLIDLDFMVLFYVIVLCSVSCQQSIWLVSQRRPTRNTDHLPYFGAHLWLDNKPTLMLKV